MKFVKVPENREEEHLKEFENNSTFTFEGIDIKDKSGAKDFEKLAREKAGFKEKEMIGYWFKGSVMNRVYGLTESNAYPEDLTFLAIPNLYNPVFKMMIGARWFDDIVHNNSIKQRAVDTGVDPDFDYVEEEEDEE